MGFARTRAHRRAFRRRPCLPTLLLAATLAGCASTGGGAMPDRDAAHIADTGRLLKEVEAQVLAAQDAQLAFLVGYPVEGLDVAQRHVTDVHAAIGQARMAVAAITDLPARPGPPGGCCGELEAGLTRYEDRFRELVSLAGRRGDGSSGLLRAADRTLAGLERYLDRLETDDAASDTPPDRADAIRAIRSDVDAIRRYEAQYNLRDDLGGIVSIGNRVVSQREFLETSPLEARERARVDTHVRTYLIYLERVAVTDVEIFRARRDLNRTTARIQALVRRYADGGDVPLPRGYVI